MNYFRHSTMQNDKNNKISATENGDREKIYLLQPVLPAQNSTSLQLEAISLIESAGALYAGTMFVQIREINPATYIGKGKLEELQTRLDGLELTVLFNGELSPSQTLNISSSLGGLKVIDRTTLILDIFAKNAKTNEGKLQVELAQLQYIYPRLKGKGEALSRLGGGIGTRGPGETQLETDRRRIRARINAIESRLKGLENRRCLLTARRKKTEMRTISLIGYTNTGKSTLLNQLTASNVYAENRLFATLDPTSRRLVIDNQEFIVTDTVGFLRELPHNIISAFKSTLESALTCDLALIVCDATDDYEMQLSTTLHTLEELDFNVPYLIVINKSENLKSYEGFPAGSIFISAKENIGIDGLKNEIMRHFQSMYTDVCLCIPYARISAYNQLKRYAVEKEFAYKETHLQLKARIPNIYLKKFSEFIQSQQKMNNE